MKMMKNNGQGSLKAFHTGCGHYCVIHKPQEKWKNVLWNIPEMGSPGTLDGAGGRGQLLLQRGHPPAELRLPVLRCHRFPGVGVLDLQEVVAQPLQLQLEPLLLVPHVLKLAETQQEQEQVARGI